MGLLSFATTQSGFSQEELVYMLGDKRTETLKSGDYVVFTVVLYNADEKGDFVKKKNR